MTFNIEATAVALLIIVLTCMVIGMIWLGGILEECRRELTRIRVIAGKVQWSLGPHDDDRPLDQRIREAAQAYAGDD